MGIALGQSYGGRIVKIDRVDGYEKTVLRRGRKVLIEGFGYSIVVEFLSEDEAEAFVDLVEYYVANNICDLRSIISYVVKTKSDGNYINDGDIVNACVKYA